MRRVAVLCSLVFMFTYARAQDLPVSVHDLQIMQDLVTETSTTTLVDWSPLGTDFRHRSVSQDIDEWVKNDITKAQLDKFMSRAETDGSAAEAAQQVLMDQMRRLSIINAYWCAEWSLSRQRQLWSHWVGLLLPDEVAQQSVRRVSARETAYMQRYNPATDADSLSRETRELLETYNDERLLLTVPANARLSRIPGSLKKLDRDIACGKDNFPAPTDTSFHPVKVVSMPDLSDYYPEITRRSGSSGRVVLRLSIDEHGCMKRAEVDQSSGDPELDDAALQFSERIRFTPLYVDGTARDSQTHLPVLFQLQ